MKNNCILCGGTGTYISHHNGDILDCSCLDEPQFEIVVEEKKVIAKKDKKMKFKFTKASKSDKTLVTVNLAQFKAPGSIYIPQDIEARLETLRNEDTITLYIEGQGVIFYVNRVRNGKAVTAVSHCFPRFLRLPTVGRPTYAETEWFD